MKTLRQQLKLIIKEEIAQAANFDGKTGMPITDQGWEKNGEKFLSSNLGKVWEKVHQLMGGKFEKGVPVGGARNISPDAFHDLADELEKKKSSPTSSPTIPYKPGSHHVMMGKVDPKLAAAYDEEMKKLAKEKSEKAKKFQAQMIQFSPEQLAQLQAGRYVSGLQEKVRKNKRFKK